MSTGLPAAHTRGQAHRQQGRHLKNGEPITPDNAVDDHPQLTTFLLQRDLDQARTLLRQLVASAVHGSSAEQQARAATEVLDRAERTLTDLLGPAPDGRGRPTRIAPLIAQVAHSHDPEGRRIVWAVPSIVASLDTTRFERTIDQLLAHVLSDAAPGTNIELNVASTPTGLQLSVVHDGRALHPPPRPATTDELTSWEAVVTLVDAQHGQLRRDEQTGQIEIDLPRRNP